MFSLSIALRDNPVVWTLMFKSKETAEAAYAKLVPSTDDIQDDFGQTVMIGPSGLSGAILEDLDQSKLAHIERALHTARTNANAQSRAQSDPVLKAAMMTQGPAMISPMNGSGYR